MKSLYITADQVEGLSGGGQLARHEINALKSISDAVEVWSRPLKPQPYQDLDVPFLDDYFVGARLNNDGDDGAALIHFYSGSFSNSIGLLKSIDLLPRVSYTCPAHDREISIEEYEHWYGSYPYKHLNDPELWGQFKQGLLWADAVIAPSQHSANFLRKEGVPEEHLKIIPHGCELPPLDAIKPYPETFRVGYLGQIGSDKGLRYLIEAWGKLAYPDAELVLAGRGTESLEPLIQRLAPRGRFRLLGWVQDIGDFYNMISLYVQPSVTEAWGIEVGEALGYGRPVVLTKGVGAADMLLGTSTIAGLTTPIRDSDSLAAAINWMRQHRTFEQSKVCCSVAERYAWPVIEERYKEMWRTLLGHDYL